MDYWPTLFTNSFSIPAWKMSRSHCRANAPDDCFLLITTNGTGWLTDSHSFTFLIRTESPSELKLPVSTVDSWKWPRMLLPHIDCVDTFVFYCENTAFRLKSFCHLFSHIKQISRYIVMFDVDFFPPFFIITRYSKIVKFLISDTNFNWYRYIWPWTEHIMASLYCDVPQDAASYQEAILSASSHHWNHPVKTLGSLTVMIRCSLMTSLSVVEVS